jgi:GNAT superfamily N-acetyltransferase
MPVSVYCVEPLKKAHDREAFKYFHIWLDRYLHQQARQDGEKRVAATFVARIPPSLSVLGYYTLSASIVNASDIPAPMAKKIPRYPQLLVTLLGRLAVDQRYQGQGQGLGQFLLMDALHRSLQETKSIAAMAVVVDAKDDTAAAFYRHYGFLTLTGSKARLFLPMQTVAALFDVHP